MAIRAGLIQVCINNNHLASIYNLMAKGSERAKFLTSDDLQFLSALITYHYSQDEQYNSSNFSCADGRRLNNAVPRFYAMPYRIEKKAWRFLYGNEFLSKYRGLYHKCVSRFGKNWESEFTLQRIQFARLLSNNKVSSMSGIDDFVNNLYLTASEQVLEETQYRDFAITTSSRVSGAEMQRGIKFEPEEMKDWIDSQFYIMKEGISGLDSERMLNDLLDLLSEYFDTGLPYLLYYQRTWGNPNIGLKLKFDEAEKERFKKAFKLAIQDFARTSRLAINNNSYGTLQQMTSVESSAGEMI